MLIYHGSNVEVSKPRLIPQNRFLDFGFGFYTTTNRNQAESFAQKVTRRRKEGRPIVNCYQIDEEQAFSQCSVLRFDKADEAWLDFVSANRAGNALQKEYDLIFGPVADDDVYRTFALYSSGVLTKQQTVEALKVKKLFNQLVFATEKALSFLTFAGAVTVEE